MATYSFLNCQCGIVGPGGAFSLGSGSGVADEGITVVWSDDKNTMQTGADGAVMHTLNASKSGTITIRYLKTSPTNYQLSLMYNIQTVSSALHGLNTITIRDTARGDIITGRNAAFRKYPNLSYTKAGALNEWDFSVGQLDALLGSGSPSLL